MARVIDTLITKLGYKFDRKSAGDADARIRKMGQSIQQLGFAMTGAGIALTAFNTQAVRTFAKFESTMARIVGLVGVPAEQLRAWQPELRRIATATGQGPVKLAEALFYVTSAGIRGKEAIEILENSARGAAVGLGEPAVIVDLLTSAINAYGIESLSAAQATNDLAMAVRLGKLEPDSMDSRSAEEGPGSLC